MEGTDKKSKYIYLMKHGIGILTLILVISIVSYFMDWGAPHNRSFMIHFFQAFTGTVVVIFPIVYFNIYYLIPNFLAKRKYLHFIIGTVFIVGVWGPLAIYFEDWTDQNWFGMSPEKISIEDPFLAGLFIFVISTSFRLSYNWFIQLSRIKQIENDRLNIELSLLKNQISPHFFFNTLNNLYALALEQSLETPDIILKLSEMMRYTIYDCKEPLVNIGNEIKYLKNYIALQKIRLDNSENIKFNCDISDKKIKIAPMILVVFLENAFKHGVEILHDDAFININLKVSEEEIIYKMKNNFERNENKEPSGLGLENVKRRLSLIYPEQHELKIYDSDGIFEVELRIKNKPEHY